MKTVKFVISLGVVTVLLGTGGCMTNPDSSPDFRASVNNMHERQTWNPAAASVPPADTVQPADGGVSARVVDGYRETATPKGDSIQNEIHINVGN